MVALKQLWLLRHGSTASTEGGRFLGWVDEPLSAAGRAEVLAVRQRVTMIAPDHVWSSDLSRAVESARLVIDGEPWVDRRLREIDFGDIEGLTWDQLTGEHRDALGAFEAFSAPGGETLEDLRARVRSFTDGLGPGTHLLVTHGGVIRLLLRERGDFTAVRPGELRSLGEVRASRPSKS